MAAVSTGSSHAPERLAAVAGKPESDGAFCHFVQRRASAPIARIVGARTGPNAVTAAAMLVGGGGALSVALGRELVGVALIQVFGVLSCVDGEVARLRDSETRFGDFFDTLVDRAVELAVLAAVGANAAIETGEADALVAALGAIAAVALLAVSAEKFRASFGHGYPKRRLEPLASWVTSGSDARLMLVSAALVTAAVTSNPRVLVAGLWALGGLVALTLVVRVVRVARLDEAV